MQGKYYEENMVLNTRLINVITFGGPHRVALLLSALGGKTKWSANW